MTHSSPWPVQWPGHQLRQRKAGHDASVPPCSTRSPVCQFRQSHVMCGQTMMSVTLVLVLSVKLANSDIKLETCSSSHQVTALDLFSRHSCQPRQEIVQLEVPSDMNIVQVCNNFAPSEAKRLTYNWRVKLPRDLASRRKLHQVTQSLLRSSRPMWPWRGAPAPALTTRVTSVRLMITKW